MTSSRSRRCRRSGNLSCLSPRARWSARRRCVAPCRSCRWPSSATPSPGSSISSRSQNITAKPVVEMKPEVDPGGRPQRAGAGGATGSGRGQAGAGARRDAARCAVAGLRSPPSRRHGPCRGTRSRSCRASSARPVSPPGRSTESSGRRPQAALRRYAESRRLAKPEATQETLLRLRSETQGQPVRSRSRQGHSVAPDSFLTSPDQRGPGDAFSRLCVACSDRGRRRGAGAGLADGRGRRGPLSARDACALRSAGVGSRARRHRHCSLTCTRRRSWRCASRWSTTARRCRPCRRSSAESGTASAWCRCAPTSSAGGPIGWSPSSRPSSKATP